MRRIKSFNVILSSSSKKLVTQREISERAGKQSEGKEGNRITGACHQKLVQEKRRENIRSGDKDQEVAVKKQQN